MFLYMYIYNTYAYIYVHRLAAYKFGKRSLILETASGIRDIDTFKQPSTLSMASGI